ncbi:MAG: hypothetical protein WBM28_04255 [Burkholderiales bacterium]
MIEVAIVAIKVLCIAFLALGGILSLAPSGKKKHLASGSVDLERFSYAAANDFETDYRGVCARRDTSVSAAA